MTTPQAPTPESTEHVGTLLVDLSSFKPDDDGVTVLFFRPKRALTDEESAGTMQSLEWLKFGNQVKPVLIPHDMELIAVGPAELRKLGIAVIPSPAEAERQAFVRDAAGK